MAKLTTMEGMGGELEGRLKKLGIRGTAALLRRGSTRQERVLVCTRCGIDERLLRRFVIHADLMRIRGIGGVYAEMLEAARVRSVQDLSNQDPVLLHDALLEVAELRGMVRVVPSEKRLATWVKQAGKLRPLQNPGGSSLDPGKITRPPPPWPGVRPGASAP